MSEAGNCDDDLDDQERRLVNHANGVGRIIERMCSKAPLTHRYAIAGAALCTLSDYAFYDLVGSHMESRPHVKETTPWPSLIDDARAWAYSASPQEIEAYCTAAFAKLPTHKKVAMIEAFMRHMRAA